MGRSLSSGLTTGLTSNSLQPNAATAAILSDLDMFDGMAESIQHIEQCATDLNRLRHQLLKATIEADRQECLDHAERTTQLARRTGEACLQMLRDIKWNDQRSDQRSDPKKDVVVIVRRNLHRFYTEKFQRRTIKYKNALYRFRDQIETSRRRQLSLFQPELDQKQAEQILDLGLDQQVVQETLLSEPNGSSITATSSATMEALVSGIDQRHLDIVQLERQVVEIHELFRDVASLVDQQQESLNIIDGHVGKARHYTEHGEVELQDAKEYQDKSRSRMQCICACLLIGLLIIAVVLASVLVKINQS